MAMETQGGEIELIDEEINDTDKVIFADPVLQTLRKKRSLIAMHSLDETPIPTPPSSWKCGINRGFHTDSASLRGPHGRPDHPKIDVGAGVRIRAMGLM